MAQLLIEVSGGVIQDIYSTDGNVSIAIIDHDNLSQVASYGHLKEEFRHPYLPHIIPQASMDELTIKFFEDYRKRVLEIEKEQELAP